MRKDMKLFMCLIVFMMMSPIIVFADNNRIYTDKYYSAYDNPSEYPYKSDEFVQKIYMSEEKKKTGADRKIINETEYVYNSLSFRYVVINGIIPTTNTYLSEVEIFNNNSLVPYTYSCTNCYGNIQTNLNNGLYYDDIDRPMFGSFTMVIDLGEVYNPDNIKMTITFANPNKEKMDTKFNIWMLKNYPSEVNETSTFDDAVIYKNNNILNSNEEDTHKSIFLSITEKDIVSKVYDNKVYSDTELNNLFYELVTSKTYTYKEKFYKYYKVKESIKKGVSRNQNNNNQIINRLEEASTNNDSSKLKVTDKLDNSKKSDTNKNECFDYNKGKLMNESDDSNKSFISIWVPAFFGTFLVLLFISVYAFYKLKKEKEVEEDNE